MSKNNNFEQTVQTLFDGLDHVISAKTVVGEPQIIGDTTIVPLVDVSFGMGAGSLGKEKSDSGAGGLGGKMIPSAILVIKNGETRMINVRNRDAVTKALDLVPEVVNRISSLISSRGKGDAEVEEVIKAAELPEEPVRKEI